MKGTAKSTNVHLRIFLDSTDQSRRVDSHPKLLAMGSAGAAKYVGGKRGTVSHHFRMPGEHEEQNENTKTSADEKLDEAENGGEPVEETFS